MIAQLILPLALLPQRGETDLGDILKIVILLLLPAAIGIGKTILDRAKRKEAASAKRRGPIPAGPGAGPGPRSVSSIRPREEEDEPIDQGDFWEELVAQATEEQSSGAARPVPLPANAEAAVRPRASLGLDLDPVDDSLPSRHEEYYESHPNADLVERGAVGARIKPAAAAPRHSRGATQGSTLRASVHGRDGWKRAIVLAEVLGSPLGLRKGYEWPGMG